MLAYQWHAETGQPMVFLHGLLGSQQDWQAVLTILQNFPQIRPLTIDLPLHGKSVQTPCHSFEHARALLHEILSQLIQEPFILVGYSLGGRLALDYHLNQPNPYLQQSFLEGANIGLKTDAERNARQQNDAAWAQRFCNEPMPEVLEAWYQQPVFSHLSADKRSDLIGKRQKHCGKAIAQMLEATSLAKQPDFSLQLPQSNIQFIIGEYDKKFRQMAEQHSLPMHLISNAGHNAHLENPKAFVEVLCQALQK